MIRNTPPGARIRMRTLLVTALVLTMVGAMGVQPAHAATSSALRFDGANDYVSFGNASALGLSNFTVETWFRREGAGVATSTSSAGQGGLTSAIPLLTKGRGQADGSNLDMNWFLGIDTSTSTPRITADFEEGATANPGLNHAIFGTTPIVQNSWYHAAATYNGSVLRVYLNGTLEASATVNRAAQAGSIQHAALGSALTSTGAAGGFFNGTLEEPRVWNAARTEAQIRDTLNQEVTSAPGLVARWGLNEGSGATAANTVGPPNGTLLGTAPVAQWVSGLPFSPDPVAPGNYALAFSDTNSYATMGAAPTLALTTFTVEGWFKRTGAGTTNTTGTGGIVNAIPLFGKGAAELETPANLNMNYLVAIDDDADVLAADFEDTAGGANHPIRGTTTIQNGRWYHAAATFDGANWRLYLDGNLEADLPVTATPEASSIQHFGLATSITSTGQRKGYFHGELDEVRVWDHARSPAQIGSSFDQEITAAPGLVASFGLNEGVGTVAGDQAGDDVSGVIYNAGWVDGFSPAPPPPTSSDRALDFDGTNDYVTFGDPASLDLAQFTVETWFKREGVGTATTTGTGGIPDALPLLTHGAPQAEGSNVDMDWFLGLDQSSGVLVADLEQGVGGTGTLGANHPVSGVTPVTDTDWHHAAATYDGATWRLYLDGQLDRTLAVNQPTRSDTTQLAALATALESTGEANGFFAGALDEARVWNRALSAAEIAGNMDLALTSGTGLVSRWGLNEGVGTTVANSIAGGAAGTTTNGPIWVNGFSVPPPPPPDPGNFALDFDGSDDHVTFGDPAALDLAQFTIETWFRRDGAGTATTTGTDGIPDALPLVTHGGPEADGTALDYNWFLGVDQSSGVLVADFEEGVGGTGPLGANHPVSGVTPVSNGEWHHAAATYDGGTWRLYLDGELDATLVVNQPARSDTTQSAALATALLSTGARTGFFAGAIDEARVWNRARSEAEILAGMQSELSTGTGLVARWGINEGAGDLLDDSVGAATGTAVNGPAWIAGAPFGPPPPPNDPPDAPSAPSPAGGATGVRTPPTLAVDASDPNGGPLDVRFYGRPLGPPTPEDFTMVAIPDTQHYVDSPAREATFGVQTQWIVDSSDELNTRFVTHLGDVTEHIDQSEQEWIYADEHMTVLDANGIPNNLAPGNHDMSSAGVAGFYDDYFPPSRYEGNDWYGGYMGDAGDGIAESRNRLNKDNYETFEVDGLDFLVIHLEYDMPSYAVQWAQNVIAAHPDHRVIISTHLFLSTSGSRPTTVLNRTADGTSAQAVWNQLIFPNCNVFLVLNGHYPGEANRTDPNSCGEPVHQLESDYQSRANGGDGWLRIMTFEPAENEIEVFTYSPTKDQFENDPDSRLTLSYDMQGNPFQQIGPVQTVASGNRASVQWNGLDLATDYEWYAAVSDRSRETPGPTWSFTTAGPNLRPSVTSAEVSPTTPTTEDLLAANVVTDDPDGDAVDLDFQWQRDTGAGFADIPGATSGTLDLSLAGAGDEGDALRVIVTPSDEGGAGAPFTSSPVTVTNSPPAVSVELDDEGPGTNATLTATPTTSDPDTADTVTVVYEWRRNGAVLDGETGDTLDLSEPGNGDIGDTITVVVTPNDGTVDGPTASGEAIVGNAAPQVSDVTIEQATPRTNDTLTLSVTASDDEGDPFDLTYRWQRQTTPGDFQDIAGATGPTLDLSLPGNGDRGHVIRAVVVATDAGASSDPFASDAVQVLNTSPTATVEITPATPTRRSTLTATVTSDDVDGDALSLHYVWTNGATVLRERTTVDSSDQLDLSGLTTVARGDTVHVSVSPNDMEDVGPAAEDEVVIGNAAPAFDANLGDRTHPEGAAVSLAASATDPDWDTLTYAASGLPPGLSIDTSTGLISGTIAAGAASGSPYATSITVSEDDFATIADTDSFTWTVTLPPPAPSIAFRSASTGANNVGSTVVIPRPAGLQAGDVMIAVLDAKAAPTVTTPAGWTLESTTPNGSNFKQAVYVRVATGSEPASTTWTINQSRAISGVIVAYRGVHTADPVEVVTAGIGSTAAITAPSATSAFNGAMVIGAFGANADTPIAPPAGMTERGEIASAARIRTEVADVVLPAAGPTGAKTATAASATANIGQLIVLRPGGPAGPNLDPSFAQNLPDRSDPATSPITLSAGATDPEGDTLAYAATGLPTGLSINATTGQITGTIAAGATANSPYATSITVSDDNFATVGATDTFTWTVTAAPPAPPIAFRSVASAANNTTTSLILPRPAGVLTGDVMVAVVDVRQNPTATAPAGWSEVSMTPNGTTYRQFVFTKVATGSEPTSYTFGFNQSRRASGAIAAYSGVSTTNPVESVTAATASSTAITAPSATTVAPQAMVVGAFSINNSSAIAPPAGMTERAEVASGSAIKTEVADVVQTSPGATGAKTATAATATANIGQLIVLRPAGPPVNQDPTFDQNLANRTNNEGAVISLSAHATDPESDTLTYAATGLPTGLSINTSTGLISGTISAGASTTSPYSVSITVSDDNFATVGATDTFTWTVTTGGGGGGSITFRSASFGANNVGNNVVIPTPAGVQTGDVMVAVIDAKAGPTITTPAGWTLLSTTPHGSNFKQAVYSRVATGSEPASTTWTINQSRAISGGIVAYAGVNTSNPVEILGTAGTGTTASITAPSVTSALNGAMVIGAFGINADSTIAPPAGMTERGEIVSATRLRTEISDVVLASAGATGAKTATAATASANIGQLIVLRPA